MRKGKVKLIRNLVWLVSANSTVLGLIYIALLWGPRTVSYKIALLFVLGVLASNLLAKLYLECMQITHPHDSH
jgi:hypothetical protein